MHLILPLLALLAADAPARPNVVFILCDDLARGDLGCYGQKLIQTPNLDRMAAEGMRFTQAYCGTSVCAPSRSSLMTGLDMGHCPVRANRATPPEGQMPLPEGTYTVAKLFHDNGYATAAIGKWGMGMFDTTGSPLKVGFDHFFGYNCQAHAHSYFPQYIYVDDERHGLTGNDGKGVGKVYAQKLISDDMVAVVRNRKDKPFFLFLPFTLPHGRYEIDSLGQYADKDWTTQQKTYAAMVSRLDSDVGRLLAELKSLNIDDKTLVMFSGDNGSASAPESSLGRHFSQAQGLRGFKRGMYEGGLRQASIARWPGQIPAGKVSDTPWAFWDFLPTCAELIGTKLPEGVPTNGVSIVSVLKGGAAPARDHFYWELHEGGSTKQAVRFGDWKAVKNNIQQSAELYDLASDPGETKNVAAEKPDVLARAEKLLITSRVDSADFPLTAPGAAKKGKGNKAKVKAKQ